jgi:choice-of-anchor C domain-containing protein
MLAVAGALAVALPATANAAAFINGGFENASVNPGGGFATLGTGSTAIDGWTVLGNSVDYIGGYWQPAEGNRSVDLNGTKSGGIQQTFDTTEGKQYKVTFSLAGNPDGGPIQKIVSTVANGNASQSYFFDTTGQTRSNMGWKQFSYIFTADGATTTLGFTSSIAGAYGAALDAVSVSGVPEPTTWAMMILGIGFAGVAMRRKQQAVRYNFA